MTPFRKSLCLAVLVCAATASVALAATLTGTNGPDTIIGTNSGDTINARSGDDMVWGLKGNDRSTPATATTS
jgi:Ca2+-binding RTX toxin-like protein